MLNGSKDKRICFGWAKHVGSQNCNIFSRTLPGIIRLPVSLCSVLIYISMYSMDMVSQAEQKSTDFILADSIEVCQPMD
jgi:hypothetical protein